jgi:NitT/TauT family transport system ATP-binding protein
MIILDQVSFFYSPRKLIFDAFTWQVDKGESWAVLGTSGCGKTTLFYLLAGLRQPQGGEIKIAGEYLQKPRPKTGLILQDYGLLPWATVGENVTLGLRIRQFYGPDGTHAPSDEDVAEIDQTGNYWMERLGILDLAGQYPQQISGGQRQRTAIARTLATNPDLLLMDEPFASLDAPTRENLQHFIIELRIDRKITNIIVTHSIEEAVVMGKRILVLKGMPNKTPVIFENPNSGEKDYLHSEEYLRMIRLLRQELEL